MRSLAHQPFPGYTTMQRRIVAGVFAIVAIGFLVASAAVTSVVGPASPTTSGHEVSTSSPAVSGSSAAPISAPSTSPGLSKALAIEAGLRAKGISPTSIHLPNFAGAVTDTHQTVAPSYVGGPAPMGVADIGLKNRAGALVPYELNTSSVAGTVNITNLQSLYVDGDGPDTYGIQLNSVANGVTVFGNSSYEYWSQNYVDYTVSTEQLVFGDEVWNFSNPTTYFPANSVYGFSPNGTAAFFPFLYQGYGPAITIGYPFTLTLYLNTSIIQDRPALYFNYSVSNDTFHQSSSFDYLIFNSTVGKPHHRALKPYYQADGYNYDPVGLINDMEIDLLGNDDGDTTAFLSADATISLQYLNAASHTMRTVPSAFNAGEETGETSVGLSVYSSGGAHPVGVVRTGPSFVEGLWNYSSGSGAEPITVDLQPANAFLFVNSGSSPDVQTAQWVPTSSTGTTVVYLRTGGSYYFDFLMSDYTPTSFVQTATAPETVTVHLAANSAEGVYTPLFALNNAELAAISSSGAGTPAHPYVLVNNQYGPLAPQFAQWDDYLFPIFPGLLLANTSAWVDVTPPSFEINIPSYEYTTPYLPLPVVGLPSTNHLQINFYDASNISLVHAPGISGWLSAFLFGYPEASVILWGCENILVASNNFADQGNALLLYGGTQNTVWGNRFFPVPIPGANLSMVDDSGVDVTGINETEAGDLIYNNFFALPLPALTPTTDPFLCDQYGDCPFITYLDTWNVSKQPATDQRVVNGYVLTGSIIGTWYQGGNFWSNYGTRSNPFGVLPYNDSGDITVGGDYVPLVLFHHHYHHFWIFPEVGFPSGRSSAVAPAIVAGRSPPSGI